MNLIEALNNSKKYRLKKSKIESKILDKADTIIEYLIKCFIWKNSTEELDLWCLKISDALSEVPKLKNDKFPSSKLIMNYTFEANKEILADTIDITYKNLLDWDGYKDIDYNQKEVYDQIYNYFNWLSKMLSEKGVISKTEIRNKIIELNNF